MAERVLCETGPRVSVDGGGERTMLSVGDGAPIRFWADVAQVEGALRGQPLLLSAHGGLLVVGVAGEAARVEFTRDGESLVACEISVRDVEDALAWVRTLPDPSDGD